MTTQLFTLIILFFLTTSFAQRPDFMPNEQEINRLFFFSSSAPITTAINTIAPSVAQHIQTILGQVDFIEKRILTALATGKLVRPLCMITDQRLNNSIFRYFGLRGLPDPDRGCITQVRAESDSLSENAPLGVDEFYTAINERGIILNQNMRDIASRFIDVQTNFTGAETPHGFVYNTDSARCVLHSVCGIREGPDWLLATPIHNRPKYENVPDFGRQVLNEYARIVDGSLGDNLRMRLTVFRVDDLPRQPRSRATTYISSGSRMALSSCFRSEPIPENPAVVDALVKVDQDLTKAESAIKPSTIAILVFPIGFTLVPIALFAEVRRASLMYYMLLTDVLTCIPLLIKGIELISIHRSPNRAFTMRITAALNGSRSESAAAEVWAADCRSPDRIKNAGVAFLIVAVFFIIGGICAEVVAWRYAKEHKKRSMEKAYEGSGRMLGVWADGDSAERQMMQPNLRQDAQRTVTFVEE